MYSTLGIFYTVEWTSVLQAYAVGTILPRRCLVFYLNVTEEYLILGKLSLMVKIVVNNAWLILLIILQNSS